MKRMRRMWRTWRYPLARAVPVIMAGLLAMGTGAGTAAQAAVSATGGALTCFAVDVSGSNVLPANGEPPSDPGPVFVRQQVVELYDEILADLGYAGTQRVSVVTFGTGIGAELGPVAISASGPRSRLAAELHGALRPPAAEAAWTDWVAGVDGCRQIFERSGAAGGMVAVLTDGFPEGPAGGPARQLAAISRAAQSLWAKGIAIQSVLYGAAAGQQGPARIAMARLAALGHGQLILAATALDMLRGALHLASFATGLPLGGAEVPVNGNSTVPLDLPPGVARAVLVVLRNSVHARVSVIAPDGETISALPVGAGGLGLVIAIPRPAPGTYQAIAQGHGSVFAAELLRHAAVAAPHGRSGGYRYGSGRTGHVGAHGLGLAWKLGLGVLPLAAALLVTWLFAVRRRPKGALVVWVGSRPRLVDPADLDGSASVAALLDTGGELAGWFVRWAHRAPTIIGPDGAAVRLLAEETRAVDTSPPATFTWFPDGIDTPMSGEPPGRPVEAAAEPTPQSHRK